MQASEVLLVPGARRAPPPAPDAREHKQGGSASEKCSAEDGEGLDKQRESTREIRAGEGGDGGGGGESCQMRLGAETCAVLHAHTSAEQCNRRFAAVKRMRGPLLTVVFFR